MSDMGMDNDGMGHTHTWERDGGSCVCGEPVPVWLAAAWERHSEATGS